MTDTLSHHEDPQTPKKRSRFWRLIKWLFIIGFVGALIAAIVIFVYVIRATRDLPSVESLSEYSPAIMSRVHAGDGKLISEFRTEARVFVPIETVPTNLQRAFISSEDQRFYTHNGWDPKGLLRAAVTGVPKYFQGKRVGGTSTITQQVAKNFLVGDDYSIDRKIREIAIAGRMEKAFTKDEILELYVNDNYFGRGAYGIAAASLNHFGKNMEELTLGEMAYLALIVKGPSNYELDVPEEKEAALARRRYVLRRMVEDGYISQGEADAGNAEPLESVDRLQGDQYLAAEYFVEEARKQIYELYGQDELYEGGLSIRTTLDTSMQLEGRRALRRGLEMMDRRHGYRGPLASFENMNDWKLKLADVAAPADIGDWRKAVVLEVSDKSARLAFIPPADWPEEETFGEDQSRGTMALSDIDWAKKALADGAVGPALKSVKQVLKTGDVILVQRKPVKAGEAPSTEYNLRQIPKANGGLIAMDPNTGRILALIGGYSFEQSQYNRATQAKRQPGSAFKPFVYAAALNEGFTPASQVLDAPFVIERSDADCEDEKGELELRGAQEARDDTIIADQLADGETGEEEEEECERFYKPENYNAGNFYGLSTLRLGIEKSRNAMTVRLANEMGMLPVMRLSKDFGIYDEPKQELAWALGAGETTLMKMATAYSTMINGGKAVEPRILDRVQDGDGKTIYNAFETECSGCSQDNFDGGPPPDIPDTRAQIIDPVTAYQITYIMQGVVENGTGARLRALGRPLGGKTGTTNDSFDNWFMGFSPDLVVGVYIGIDTPEQMGRETGSSSAVPIVKDFLESVLKDQPKVPFRIPDGVTLAPINRTTGEPTFIGAPEFILEAFRPGTEPTVGGLRSKVGFGSGGNTLGGFFGSTTPGANQEDESFDEFDLDNDFLSEEETSEAEGLASVLDRASDAVDASRDGAPADEAEDGNSGEASDEDAPSSETQEGASEDAAPSDGEEAARADAPEEDASADEADEEGDEDADEDEPEDELEEALDDGLY